MHGAIIRKVTLPDTVTKIYEDAFSECKDLTTINIPASVKEISGRSFSECYNLTNFNVDPNNPYLTFEDGILYSKDKTRVIMCLPSKKGKVTLDEKVKTIEEYAFYYCKDITGVELGNNVEEIKAHAFDHADIDAINIPKSVKTIGKDAFDESVVKFVKIENGSKVKLESQAFSDCINCKAIIIPSSVTEIADDAFDWYEKNITYYVYDNSKALDYVKTKGKTYEILDPNESKTKILSGMIVLDRVIYDYDGTEKKPNVTVFDGGKILTSGKDYNLSYSNNIDHLLLQRLLLQE